MAARRRRRKDTDVSLTILAWPLDRSHENPYTNNLYRALEARGQHAMEFSFRALLFGRYDILHVHWPEGVLPGRRLAAAIAAAASVGAVLAVARLRGAAVVWTVHNEQPHRPASATALKVLRTTLRMTVSGLVYLSDASRHQYEAHQSWARRKQSVVTPHGRFGVSHPSAQNERQDTRRALGVDDTQLLVSFLGRMEAYKGPHDLVAAFSSVVDKRRVRLLMAGTIPNTLQGVELRRALDHESVLVEEGWLSDARFAQLCAASDLVVYPYKRILNSGSVLLPLEYRTPVLAPREGSVPEIARMVGPGWVRMYEGSLRPDALVDAANAPRPRMVPDMRAFEWDAVALMTSRFFVTLVGS